MTAAARALNDDVPRDYRDPDGAPWWAEYTIEYGALHNFEFDEGDAGVGSFGNDYLAGGEKHDQVFGQLGHDVVQGDGGIEDAFIAEWGSIGPAWGMTRTVARVWSSPSSAARCAPPK